VSDDGPRPADKILDGGDGIDRFLDTLRAPAGRSHRLDADPERLEKGLAQLVLTVVELLRQLMERQAIRRMEGGTLDDDEVERLGQAFMALEERMEELKETFGLDDEDLNLDLGPLGPLLATRPPR
jgi:hypothetical protein